MHITNTDRYCQTAVHSGCTDLTFLPATHKCSFLFTLTKFALLNFLFSQNNSSKYCCHVFKQAPIVTHGPFLSIPSLLQIYVGTIAIQNFCECLYQKSQQKYATEAFYILVLFLVNRGVPEKWQYIILQCFCVISLLYSCVSVLESQRHVCAVTEGQATQPGSPLLDTSNVLCVFGQLTSTLNFLHCNGHHDTIYLFA